MQQYFFSKADNTLALPLLDGVPYQAKGEEVSTGRYHYVIRVDTGLGRWPAFVGMGVAMSGIPKEKLSGVGKVLLCTTNAENMLQLASGLFEGDTADAELPSLIGEKLVVVSPKRSSANDDANKAAKETFLKNVKGVNPNVVRAIEHDMARCWVHDFTGMGAIQKPKEKVVNNEYKGGVDFKKLLSRKVLLFVALRQGVVMRVLMPVFGVFCVALLLYDAYHRFIGQSSRQTTLRP